MRSYSLEPPGYYVLKEACKASMSRHALGTLLCMDGIKLDAFLRGDLSLTAETAIKLDFAFGVDKREWLAMERNFKGKIIMSNNRIKSISRKQSTNRTEHHSNRPLTISLKTILDNSKLPPELNPNNPRNKKK